MLYYDSRGVDTDQNLTNNQEWNMNKIFGHYNALFSGQAGLGWVLVLVLGL